MSNERRERFCLPWSLASPRSDPRGFRDGGRRGESLFACLNASRLGTAVRALVQAVLLLVPVPAGAADGPQTGVTALVGATVIDGTGSKPFRDAVVLVSGERIRAVGPRGEVIIPEGARVVDMTGKWIVPGLVDAHIHLFQSGGLYTRPDIIDLRSIRPYAAEVDWVRERLPMTLARYLASGVTAVLDVGGPFWTFKARERSKTMPHAPQLAVTGPLISSHMPSELRVADPPILEVNSPDEARGAVRRVLAQGPDLIKLWWIPEASRPLGEQSRWVRAAIEEAHRAGVRVAVHATQLEVARAAVLAGADVLVHSVDDRRVDDGFVRLLKERDVVYVTTLGVNQGYREVFERSFKPTDLERRLGDAEVLTTLDDLADLSLWKGAFWKRWFLRWQDPRIASWNLRRLHEAGITVAAGSDAGNIGTLHGPALHREMERMAEAGLAPLAILEAATQGGARAMGRGSELGTVERGKRADLLVLDADPQSDIRHARRMHRVVRGGVILNPEQIAKAAGGKPPASEAERHDSYRIHQ